jgi:indolepyruvate ferredoxin oxidoreductase, alpha subunit
MHVTEPCIDRVPVRVAPVTVAAPDVLALGVEAVAYAAFDAGIKAVFGYPGTPSTEGFERAEALIRDDGDERRAHWAANEKVAYELGLGVSYAGHRVLVTMKHVGLNVAMDAFVNSAMTGVHGGFVVLVADDPGMHSSQNEQDSRYLADFANVPCLEPATVQEAYDDTYRAYDLSEQLKVPVLLRLVTRVAHCRGAIARAPRRPVRGLGLPQGDDSRGWVLLPQTARRQYQKLRDKIPEMRHQMEGFNRLSPGRTRMGIVTAGLGRALFDELAREAPHLLDAVRLEISGYPISQNLFDIVLSQCDHIFVFEESYPYIEDQLRNHAVHTRIRGRRDATISLTGELAAREMRSALGLGQQAGKTAPAIATPARPPRFCDGCGHVDAHLALKEALANVGAADARVFGDIGCYAMAAGAPLNAIHTCVEMGASLGMALGAAFAGVSPAVAVIGDSTFIHSGLPGLTSLAKAHVNVTLLVFDNRTVGMTGQQPVETVDMIEQIVVGLGMDPAHVTTIMPLSRRHEENVAAIEAALRHEGPDVVICRRECVQASRKGVNALHDVCVREASRE